MMSSQGESIIAKDSESAVKTASIYIVSKATTLIC